MHYSRNRLLVGSVHHGLEEVDRNYRQREYAIRALYFIRLGLILVRFVGHLVMVVGSLQQEPVEMTESFELIPLLYEHSHELPVISALANGDGNIFLHEFTDKLSK